MNKDTLKKYAEFGVRERLREMQRELEGLAKDFPELVCNADGTMPSVLPMIVKQRANGNGHAGPGRGNYVRKKTGGGKAAITDAARTFLVTHPAATTKEVAEALGRRPSSDLRRYLRSIASMKRTGGPRSRRPVEWTLR